MGRVFVLATLAVTVAAGPAMAQSKAGFGPVVGANATVSSFGDYYGVGWAVGGQFVKGTGFGSVMLEVTYNGFSISDQLPTGADDFSNDLNIWGFGLGPRFALGPLNVGALAGYYTEIDEFDIIPLVTINLWKLDVGVRYKGLLESAEWIGVTAAFHFGNW